MNAHQQPAPRPNFPRRFLTLFPTLHTYRGLSISRLSLFRLRTMLIFIFRLATTGPATYQKLRRLKQLRGTGRGREALVIGNGPSAAGLIPAAVLAAQQAGTDVFAVNQYCDMELSSVVEPDYYFLVDPTYVDASIPLSARAWEYIAQHARTTAVCPMHHSVPVETAGRVLWFNNFGLEGWTSNINPLWPRGYSSYVSYCAIAMAGYMGYDKIYVAGVDNTMFRSLVLSPTSELLELGRTHAYTPEPISVQRASPSSLYRGGVAAYFENVARLFGELWLFARLPLVNLDPESLIDAIPRGTSPLYRQAPGSDDSGPEPGDDDNVDVT